MVEEVHSQYIQIPYPWKDNPQTGELYHGISPMWVRVLSSALSSQSGSLASEGGAPEYLALTASGSWSQEFHRDWKKQRIHS